MSKKPWLPKFFYTKNDGGPTSGVKAYCLIEWKRFFSVALLRFNDGTREAFHSHAFNAVSWILRGSFIEEKLDGSMKTFTPSLVPKFTPRNNTHRVNSQGVTWVLTFRGPWEDTWVEYRDGKSKRITMTHNRQELESVDA